MSEPYGIHNVVGGFESNLAPEYLLPATLARTYLEHTQVRAILKSSYFISKYAAEFGSGFGRMLPVWREFSKYVWGFERDQELHECATKVSVAEGIRPIHVETLARTGAPDEHFGLVTSFTVLQHVMTDAELLPIIAEMQRVTAPQGYLLITEEHEGAWSDCVARTPEDYAKLFDKFKLVRVWPRMITETVVSGKTSLFIKQI